MEKVLYVGCSEMRLELELKTGDFGKLICKMRGNGSESTLTETHSTKMQVDSEKRMEMDLEKKKNGSLWARDLGMDFDEQCSSGSPPMPPQKYVAITSSTDYNFGSERTI